MAGAGKTSLGRRLATNLNMPFLDTDQRVSEIMAKQPADDIYAELSDWILKNDGTPEELKRKIDERLEGKVRRS